MNERPISDFNQLSLRQLVEFIETNSSIRDEIRNDNPNIFELMYKIYVHAAASGDVEIGDLLNEFINHNSESVGFGALYCKYDSFGGLSRKFREYCTQHSYPAPIRVVDAKITEPMDGDESAEYVMELLGLDVARKDEYEFRVCSNNNYAKVGEALMYLFQFGMDRDLLTKDNLFWSLGGKVWGGGLRPSNRAQIVAVYSDPRRLMEKGQTRLDEGAMGYYGLVVNDVTLRDLLIGGGVVIFWPNNLVQST